MENKEKFIELLCKSLQESRQFNGELMEMRYVKTMEGGEYICPVMAKGDRYTECKSINITGDSCIGILSDVMNQFVRRYT